jgi:hypothetical protein
MSGVLMSRVIALAGRRIDKPGAQAPRFPLERVEAVEQRLSRLFREEEASALVCSAACGADLIALQVAGALKLRRRVVLPFAPEWFRRSSVTDRPDARWGLLFDEVIAAVRATGDLVVLSGAEDDEAAYAAANEAILRETRALLSTQLGVSGLAVLVWEGHPKAHEDATEAFSHLATSAGLPVREVHTLPSSTSP